MTLVIGAQFSLFFLMVQFMQRTLGFGAFESGRLPAAQPGDLRGLPRHAATRRGYGTWPLITTGAARALAACCGCVS